jgi:hypothetical protein
MPKYRVQIDAKNLLIDMGGNLAKYGFLTFRLIEAGDSRAAENAAIQMIREDQELQSILRNATGDPPFMDVKESAEVESLDGIDNKMGRIWYEMNPKRWWQFWRR